MSQKNSVRRKGRCGKWQNQVKVDITEILESAYFLVVVAATKFVVVARSETVQRVYINFRKNERHVMIMIGG